MSELAYTVIATADAVQILSRIAVLVICFFAFALYRIAVK